MSRLPTRWVVPVVAAAAVGCVQVDPPPESSYVTYELSDPYEEVGLATSDLLLTSGMTHTLAAELTTWGEDRLDGKDQATISHALVPLESITGEDSGAPADEAPAGWAETIRSPDGSLEGVRVMAEGLGVWVLQTLLDGEEVQRDTLSFSPLQELAVSLRLQEPGAGHWRVEDADGTDPLQAPAGTRVCVVPVGYDPYGERVHGIPDPSFGVEPPEAVEAAGDLWWSDTEPEQVEAGAPSWTLTGAADARFEVTVGHLALEADRTVEVTDP